MADSFGFNLIECGPEISKPAISNNYKSKLFEILHGKHMHPKQKIPVQYNDTFIKIQNDVDSQLYSMIENHAKESADYMKSYLSFKGYDCNKIIDVAWTKNGSNDIRTFAECEDPNNDCDIMYKLIQNKSTFYIGVSLKYASQRIPNIRSIGLETLENMTGCYTLLNHFNQHKSNLISLGYTDTLIKNHEKWKMEKNTENGKMAELSKLETTRKIANELHFALSNKSQEDLSKYIRDVVAPETKNLNFRIHTRIMKDKILHQINQPNKDIEPYLNQFSKIYLKEEHSGGITVTIYGDRYIDGKSVRVLNHAIKGINGPMKGIAATTRLHNYKNENI
jgi:hypothetical protein